MPRRCRPGWTKWTSDCWPARRSNGRRLIMSITTQHVAQTHHFRAAIQSTCNARHIPMPDIRDVCITERSDRGYSFAIFPQPFGYKLEAYKDRRFLDQISSSLNGLPVTYSNSTGFPPV